MRSDGCASFSFLLWFAYSFSFRSGHVDIYQFTEIYGAVQLGHIDLGTPPLPPPLLTSFDTLADVEKNQDPYSSSTNAARKEGSGSGRWKNPDSATVGAGGATAAGLPSGSSGPATINGIESFSPLSPPAPSSPTWSLSKGSERLSPSLPTGGLSLLQSEGAGMELPSEEEHAARLAFRTGVRRQERMDAGSGDRADGKLDKRSFKALVSKRGTCTGRCLSSKRDHSREIQVE